MSLLDSADLNTELRAGGYPVLDTDVERFSAFVRAHIGIDGRYNFRQPDSSRVHRPLRDPDADDGEWRESKGGG